MTAHRPGLGTGVLVGAPALSEGPTVLGAVCAAVAGRHHIRGLLAALLVTEGPVEAVGDLP
jgi:hypothetical protein